MDFALIAQAVGMFVGTNIDDTLILAIFFGQAAGRRAAELRVVLGQYIGFLIILAASVVGALGAGLLPEQVLPYLGLIPLALGIRAAVLAWLHRKDLEDDEEAKSEKADPTIWAVAGVTIANGGDNIGVYVPVFATIGIGGMVTYCVVFLLLLAVLILLGRFFATRKPIARIIARWGHVILPIVLIAIGAWILIEGGAFGIPSFC